MTDGHVWAPDRRNSALHLTRRELIRLSQELREKADNMEAVDEEGAAKLRQQAYALQQRHALTKVEPELKAHPEIVQTMDDFDTDDYLLNTPDGIVDLRTGEMSDPEPERLMSKATAVAPTTPEDAPRWLQFIEEVTGGDEELASYLQRLAGYALTGSTQEQVLAFVHGPPATGKTVFIDTLGGLFGTYHQTAAANTFASASKDRHPADLAKLAGARLVTASETQEGRAWDTQRVKVLTGGDRVSARFMRQDFFTYQPQYQIIIVGNSEPEVKGVDEALMRRLHIVPFENRPDEIDRLLTDKLKDEWPGILAWCIDGCLEWLEDGLTPPPVVVDRTEAYRKEEDPVGLFLEHQCETGDPDGFVSRRKLYSAWSQWMGQQGENPGSLKQLRRRFHPKRHTYGFTEARRVEDGEHRRGYSGLTLKDGSDQWV